MSLSSSLPLVDMLLRHSLCISNGFQFNLPLSCADSGPDYAKPGLLYSFFLFLTSIFPSSALFWLLLPHIQTGLSEALFYLVSPGPEICNDSIVCFLKGQPSCLTSVSLADHQ